MRVLPSGGRMWVYVFVGLFLVFLPVFAGDAEISFGIDFMILALAAMALNIIVGQTGLTSFGHAAFYGVGAYSLILLISKVGIPFWLAIIISPFICAVLGAIIGRICLQLVSFYFALLTLAFAELIYIIIHRWYSLTGGDRGLATERIPDIISTPVPYYYLTLFLVTISIITIGFILNSAFGQSIQSVRENRLRAEFVGVNVKLNLLIAFVISSFFTGLAGALYAGNAHTAFPNYAGFMMSGQLLICVLLGGMFYFEGPIVGAFVYVILQTYLIPITEYWPFVFGILIVVIVLLMPGGITSFIRSKFLLFHAKKEKILNT